MRRYRRLLWLLALTAVAVVALVPRHTTASSTVSTAGDNAAMRVSTTPAGLDVAIVERHTSVASTAAATARQAPATTAALMAILGLAVVRSAKRRPTRVDRGSRKGVCDAVTLAPLRAPPLLRA